jgi:hypothetical protein
MFLNLVKIRYGDVPVFVEVASVVTQHSVEGELSMTLDFESNPYKTEQGISGKGKYIDKPTITYSPLFGGKYAQTLMRPLNLTNLFSMILSGRTIATTLEYTIHSINGIDNRFSGPYVQWDAKNEFYELLTGLQKIQEAGALGIHIDEKGQLTLFLEEGESDEVDKAIDRVKELLGLNPDLNEFSVRYGAYKKDDSEIVILTRSMLEFITDVASNLDIPKEHIDENRAYKSPAEDRKRLGTLKLQTHKGRARPADAFVAVFYKDHWFWIEDTDFASKRMLSTLVTFFTLTEPDTAGSVPLLTIQ